MRGGLDSTEISLLALMFSFLAVFVTIRMNEWPYTAAAWRRLKFAWNDMLDARAELRLTRRVSRHDAVDHFVCGDCPAVPDDLKAARSHNGGVINR